MHRGHSMDNITLSLYSMFGPNGNSCCYDSYDIHYRDSKYHELSSCEQGDCNH